MFVIPLEQRLPVSVGLTKGQTTLLSPEDSATGRDAAGIKYVREQGEILPPSQLGA